MTFALEYAVPYIVFCFVCVVSLCTSIKKASLMLVSFILLGAFVDYVYGPGVINNIFTDIISSNDILYPLLLAISFYIYFIKFRLVTDIVVPVVLIIPLSYVVLSTDSIFYFWFSSSVMMCLSYFTCIKDSVKSSLMKSLTIDLFLISLFTIIFTVSSAASLSSHNLRFLELVGFFALVMYQLYFFLTLSRLSSINLRSLGLKYFIPKSLVFYKTILILQALFYNFSFADQEIVHEIALYMISALVLVLFVATFTKSKLNRYPVIFLGSQVLSLIYLDIVAKTPVNNYLYYVLLLNSVVCYWGMSFSEEFDSSDLKQSLTRFIYLFISVYVPITLFFYIKVDLMRVFFYDSTLISAGVVVLLNHVAVMVMGLRNLASKGEVFQALINGKINLPGIHALYLCCAIISTCLLVLL